MKLTRRSVLGLGAAGAAAGIVGLPGFGFDSKGRQKRAKNIIFCVSDGMAMSAITCCDNFQQLVHGKRSFWSELMEQDYVVNGVQDTRSLSSLVTDSSAASSTWGSGRRIWNSQVNEFPDGTKLRPIASIVAEAGTKVGLVTTTTITHATPAGFAVSIANRDQEDDIARLYLNSGVDLLLGGGDKFFSPTIRKDKADLYAQFAAKGFSVVRTRDELLALTSKNCLGVFSNSHLPYTVDRENSPKLQAEVPTLAEMAKKAISLLEASPGGFLLQIEGGRVDHGAHSNDVAAWLNDQIAFEAAVKVAVEFALKDGETLVVVTSDHACGGPALNGAGFEYFDSTAGLKSVAAMKCSYGPMIVAFGKAPTKEHVQSVVKEKLGIELKSADSDSIRETLAMKSPFVESEFFQTVSSSLGMILGNYSKITWTSGNHTNDYVFVTAMGPGKERFAGITNNFAMFDIMIEAKGLKYSNPTTTFELAEKAWNEKHKQGKTSLHASPGHWLA